MKKYINKSAIIKVDGKYGPYYEIKVSPGELYKYKDSNGDVYLRMNKRKEVSNDGKTDYFEISEKGKDFFEKGNNGESEDTIEEENESIVEDPFNGYGNCSSCEKQLSPYGDCVECDLVGEYG